MKNWIGPGLDIIHSYWLKKLTAMHECLAAQMNWLLAANFHSDWLTKKGQYDHERQS